MAEILIQGIEEEEVLDRLRRRARGRGHTLEQTVRDILREAAGPTGPV